MNNQRLLMETDMNSPMNLKFYRQIIELETDVFRNEILFTNLDLPQQRALQSIAHSLKFEYEYYEGCARVFRSTTTQASDFHFIGDLGHEPTGRVQRGTSQSASSISPDQCLPQSSDTSETGIPSSFTPSQYPPIPVRDPMTISLPLGQPEAQATTGDYTMADFGPFSALPPLDSDASSSFMGFSGVQYQFETANSQPLQQQSTPDSNSNTIQTYSPNDTISMFNSTHPDLIMNNNSFDIDLPEISRRVSGTSFELFSNSDPADDSLFEHYFDDEPTILETPVDNFEYPQLSYISRGSSFTSDTSLPSTPYSRSGFPSDKLASRSGSVSSLHSDRGRKRISTIFKRSSNRSMYSSGRGEHVFDSNQTRSSSRASSSRSVRIGPLDKLARAGMRAVKAIGGACWRCKILGKKVSYNKV
jgi:hypothetical protein